MQDELRHYGVLGMKWGQRRAAANGETYRYTSHATKRYAKKADKFKAAGDKAKAEQYSKYAKKSQKLDDRMLKNVNATGGGTTAYAIASLGTGSSKTYQMLKAIGNKKPGEFDKRSAGYTAANNLIAGLVFGVPPAQAAFNLGYRHNLRKGYVEGWKYRAPKKKKSNK